MISHLIRLPEGVSRFNKRVVAMAVAGIATCAVSLCVFFLMAVRGVGFETITLWVAEVAAIIIYGLSCVAAAVTVVIAAGAIKDRKWARLFLSAVLSVVALAIGLAAVVVLEEYL